MHANNAPRQFSSWYRLDDEQVARQAPDQPAAIQVRIADGLLDYPQGHSAMVCYLFATTSARDALRQFFADELDAPGASELGALEFRIFDGRDAREWMTRLMFKFEQTFGTLPRLNQRRDSTDAPEGTE